jgi:hypothetical protein
MADIRRVTKQVQRTITEEEDVVVLELSTHEAAAVAAVLWHVGGSPQGSPRQQIDKVTAEFRKAGFDYDSGLCAQYFGLFGKPGGARYPNYFADGAP